MITSCRVTVNTSSFCVSCCTIVPNAEVIWSGPRFKLAMALGSLNGAIDLYNIFLAVLFCVVDGGDTDPVGEKGAFFRDQDHAHRGALVVFGNIDGRQVKSEVGSAQILYQTKLARFLDRVFHPRRENLARRVFLAKICLQEERRDAGMYAQVRTRSRKRGWAKCSHQQEERDKRLSHEV